MAIAKGTKDVTARVEECKQLRRRWGDTFEDPFPPDLVGHMNAFVLDGSEASGKIAYQGKALYYQFTPCAPKKTYIRAGKVWL